MINIVVIRGEGDKPGDDIVEPLLATLPAALERGRVELDAGTENYPVTLETRYQPQARRGNLVRVVDAKQGQAWIGKLTGVEHEAVTGGAISRLTLWRPSASA